MSITITSFPASNAPSWSGLVWSGLQLDWSAFGVMTLPSIGIPLLLWYSSKRKYDSPKAKKN